MRNKTRLKRKERITLWAVVVVVAVRNHSLDALDAHSRMGPLSVPLLNRLQNVVQGTSHSWERRLRNKKTKKTKKTPNRFSNVQYSCHKSELIAHTCPQVFAVAITGICAKYSRARCSSQSCAKPSLEHVQILFLRASSVPDVQTIYEYCFPVPCDHVLLPCTST